MIRRGILSSPAATLAWTGIIAALAASVGCQSPVEPGAPTVARVTVAGPDQYETLWQATDETLRQYWLQPDRQDRAEGVMTSRPETSAAWFELWRPQPTPAYAWWESNLQTIRRQAKVTIQPATAPEYNVVVEVDRYRISLPERQVDNPAAALRLYGRWAPTATTGRRERQVESTTWIPLGRDGELEHAILTNILKRYGSGEVIVPPETPATQPASAG